MTGIQLRSFRKNGSFVKVNSSLGKLKNMKMPIDMITNEQAAFMRKVFQYIDAPQYGIYFICG